MAPCTLVCLSSAQNDALWYPLGNQLVASSLVGLPKAGGGVPGSILISHLGPPIQGFYFILSRALPFPFSFEDFPPSNGPSPCSGHIEPSLARISLGVHPPGSLQSIVTFGGICP